MKKEEYKAIMTAWTDEAGELCECFRSLFPRTKEGQLKYLFAVNYMVMGAHVGLGVPEEAFSDFVRTIVGAWFAAGQPEDFEIGCLTASAVEELQARLRAIKESGSGKPSSDA